MLLNSEMILTAGAFVLQEAGATRAFRNGLERLGRPGSKNMCKRAWGFPRNLGEPVVSTEAFPEGDTGRPTPGPTWQHAAAAGAKSCVIPWYRQAKETKCGGRNGRKSQCLDSTDEAGELAPQGPGGWEARHRVATPLARNTTEALNSIIVSPQGQRIGRRAHRNLCCGEAKGQLEEPYGLMCPRTDLWEPWAGNRPGPPGLGDGAENTQ